MDARNSRKVPTTTTKRSFRFAISSYVRDRALVFSERLFVNDSEVIYKKTVAIEPLCAVAAASGGGKLIKGKMRSF